PVHTMTDQEIAAAVPQYLPRDISVNIGRYRTVLDSGTVLYPEDFLALRVVQQNFGKRPLVWSLTTGGKYFGLDGLMVQRGVGLEVMTEPPDTTNPGLDFSNMFGVPLDMPTTRRLALETYRYAKLLESEPRRLESTAAGIAQTLTVPLTQLAVAARARQDYGAAIDYLERAAKLADTRAVRDMIEDLKAAQSISTPPAADTTRP
ncbi:MAG: hypothetical protein R2909_23380, partial [Gemmatimonadales bacterium]